MTDTSHRPPKATAKCPMCSQQTMSAHCVNKGCRWFECRNSQCNATLDPSGQRGHYYAPDGQTVTHGKAKGSVVRIRLTLSSGRWVHRDISDREG